MADDTSLLFRIRGDASGAKAAVAETRQAVAGLRQSATTDLKAIQSTSVSSLGSITQTAGQLTQSIPGIGRAVNTLSTSFTSLTTATESTAAGFAALAGPLSIAVAGIVATTAAVISLGNELFDLAKSTAEFQGKLQDLSQQTGVSVETLSALEVVARTTGGSIESITASLGIFQKNLEEASETADSKAAKAFERLGVQVTDTEQTFRDTLAALARMPEGFRQTSLALELFGRGGKQVLAILKETQGDLDGTIEKLRGLGLVTTAEARRADEFNDRLTLLSVSLRGLGTEIIPLVIDVLADLQKTVADNRDAIEALKLALQGIAALFVGPLKGAIFLADSAWKTHRGEVELLIEAYQLLRTAIAGAAAEIPKQPLISAADKDGLQLLKEVMGLLKTQKPLTPRQNLADIPGLLKEDPNKARAAAAKAEAEAQARAAKALDLENQRIQEQFREHREALERERQLDLKNIDEWETASEKLVNDHRQAEEAQFDQELANARRFIHNKEDLRLAEIEIQQKRVQLANRTAEELQRIDDEAQRRREQSALKIEGQLAAINEAQREGELQAIERALKHREIIESEALTRQLEVLKAAQADRLELIRIELEQQTTSAERKIELDNQKLESEQRFTNETIRLTEEREAARRREEAARAPGAEGVPEPEGPLIILPGEEPPDVPIRDLNEALDELGKTMARVFGIGKEAGQDFANILKGAISDLAFGIGSLVENWVLLGETGPAAMRKLVASVLAGVAAQAAVKAVFELAEGFAALFFNPAEAAAHFTAAALFGSIAGVAAIAGRSVAGDLFKRPQGGSTGTGSDRSRGQLDPLTLNRNQPQRLVVEIRAASDKISQAFTAVVLNDLDTAGPIRQAFADDGRF